MRKNKIVIIGGGIAGLTAAIHLSRLGCGVTVIEKHPYPRHKVCGEYISNEVLPYLNWLGLKISELHPASISRTEISTSDGKSVTSNLPLGGFGISRYTFDNYLYEKVLASGGKVIKETVSDVDFLNDTFNITLSDGQILEAAVVLGAFGKRSNIDQKLSRGFITKQSPWLAVKAHYQGEFPSDLVALHNFIGGYCGVSKVEDSKINICYLADYATFRKYKNIEEYQQKIVCANPNLRWIFSEVEPLFEKPLTISQISFSQKMPVEKHILMIGDTAGLINPLCGNGMAIAIHSAKIASELVLQFLDGELSRTELEATYIYEWNFHFKNRMHTGRVLAALLQKKKLSGLMMNALTAFPSILPKIIRKTHGEPIAVTE